MQGRDISDLYIPRIQPISSENDDVAMMPLLLSNDEMEDAVDWRQEWFCEFNLGDEDDGSSHPWTNFIDASFALVTKEWKYVVGLSKRITNNCFIVAWTHTRNTICCTGSYGQALM